MKPENRNVSRETFEGPGRQTSLGNTDTCANSHVELLIKYGMGVCPNCERTLTNRQTRLTDYEQ